MKCSCFPLIFTFFFLGFSCKYPVKSQPVNPDDFSEYYYRISHLPKDSMALTTNNLQVPKWLKDLDFLDGYKIPIFSAIDIYGKRHNVDFKGKLTLLNFWFIACSPCVEEIPYLNFLQEKYEGKVEVISLCLDSKGDIFEFILKHPIDYVIISDARDIIENTYKMKWGYPKTIVVAPDGKVLGMTRGFSGTDDVNYQKIEQLLLKYIKE